MGQNASKPPVNGGHVVTGPPDRPRYPPSKPPTPRTPTYIVAENRVIPNGSGDMEVARKLLRPVSQELTKFHPDYADIFQYDINNSFETLNPRESIGISDKTGKENSYFGHANGGMHRDNGHISSGLIENHQDPNSLLKRTQSLERERKKPTQMNYRHRRQTSLQPRTNLRTEVIPEDPREHLYNITRKEPFSNLMPSTTSLPLKNSFDLDYSFNLTYAQLAEHRRQKRQDDIEEKVGKKMEEMTKEISESNTVPKSPFDRQNRQNAGEKSSPHSVSTGSSDNGVSKSKKKRAPAPPTPIPGGPRGKSPGRSSVTTEPPADYEMEETNVVKHTRQASLDKKLDKMISSQTPTPLSKSKSEHRQKETEKIPPPPAPKPPSPSVAKSQEFKSPLQKSMSEARAQLEALKKLEDILRTPAVDENKDKNNSKVEDVSLGDDNEDIVKDPKAQNNINDEELSSLDNPEPVNDKEQTNALNPTLQQEIIQAAKNIGGVSKSKPHAIPDKPKDPVDMFKEELANAAKERQLRRQDSQDIHPALINNTRYRKPVLATNFLKPTKSRQRSIEITKEESKSHSDLVKNDTSVDVEVPNLSTTDNDVSEDKDKSSSSDKQMSASAQRVYDETWTPEDDLDSDDDIMDDKYELSTLKTEPNNNKTLTTQNSKKEKGKIKKDVKDTKPTVEPKSTTNDVGETSQRRKIRKLRRSVQSVHEGIKNAFGSISRSSGKLLKKNKSFDFLGPANSSGIQMSHEKSSVSLDPNWQIPELHGGSLGRRFSVASFGPFHNDADISDSSDDEELGDDDIMIDDKTDHKRLNQLKRAGVAYVNEKGQIVVLPETNHGVGESSKGANGFTSRIFKKKKKKYTYESTMKFQEKNNSGEYLSEKQSELEHLRKKGLERDFQRLRDLETQEQLRRQITLLQQQQIQQAHSTLSNNPVVNMNPYLGGAIQPSALGNSPYLANRHSGYNHGVYTQGGFIGTSPVGNTPNFASPSAHLLPPMYDQPLGGVASLLGQAHTPPFSPLAGGMLNSVGNANSLPNLSSQDLGIMSEYMQRLGVAPPTNQQQWTALLRNIQNTNTQNPYAQESYQPNLFSNQNFTNTDTSHILPGFPRKTLESTTSQQPIHNVSNQSVPEKVLSPLERLARDGLHNENNVIPAALLTQKDNFSPPSDNTNPQKTIELSLHQSKTEDANNKPPTPKQQTSHEDQSSDQIPTTDLDTLVQNQQTKQEPETPETVHVQTSTSEDHKTVSTIKINVTDAIGSKDKLPQSTSVSDISNTPVSNTQVVKPQDDSNKLITSIQVDSSPHSNRSITVENKDTSDSKPDDSHTKTNGNIVSKESYVTTTPISTQTSFPAKVYGPLGFRPVQVS